MNTNYSKTEQFVFTYSLNNQTKICKEKRIFKPKRDQGPNYDFSSEKTRAFSYKKLTYIALISDNFNEQTFLNYASFKSFFCFFHYPLFPFCGKRLCFEIKGDRALIHLEGKKIKKGTWFKVIDPQGKAKGLIQIQKTGKVKAIASVKMGTIEKAWPLESISSKKARKLVENARIKKRKKYLRKIAAYERAVQKRLAQKIRRKRAIRKLEKERMRRLASVEDADNEIYSDIYAENEADEDSLAAFEGYGSENMEERVENSFPGYNDKNEPVDVSQGNKRKGAIKMSFGAFASGGLNSMKLYDTKKEPIATLSGFGYEGLGFAEINFHKRFALTGFGGYKHFKIGNDSKDCRGGDPCFLKVQYIKLGGELKYIFFQDKRFDLWGGVGGSLILPRTVDNHAGLTRKSFDLHGTVGPILGANFKTRKLIFPISVQLSLFNPPTKTTFSWSIFFRAGFGVKI